MRGAGGKGIEDNGWGEVWVELKGMEVFKEIVPCLRFWFGIASLVEDGSWVVCGWFHVELLLKESKEFLGEGFDILREK